MTQKPLWNSKATSDPLGKVFDGVISSDLLPLNDPDIPTLLHGFSPNISMAPSSLAFSCSWEVLQDSGSDNVPILLTVALSPLFRPNECPPPPFLQFSESSLRWLCFLLRFSLSFYKKILVSLSFLCGCSLYFSDTECGQIFHSFWPLQTATSNLVVLRSSLTT